MTVELILLAALTAGFVGSSHCAGMCGPIAILFEGRSATNGSMNSMFRRILYNAGRGLFYVILGAVAGFSGKVLIGVVSLQDTAAVLRLLAAAMVVIVGLHLMGFTRILASVEAKGAAVWRRLSPLTAQLLPINTPARAVGAGFIWGALPCGLVYSAAALAVSSGKPTVGALTMFVFWMGTLPTLVVIGSMAQRLRGWRSSPQYRQAAGFLLVLAALAAIVVPWLITGEQHTVHGTH